MHIAVDWSHEEDNLAVFAGGKSKITRKLPEPKAGLVIVTENMPVRQAAPLLDGGCKIFRCNTNEVAKIREQRGIEKTHNNDVRIIHELYEASPELFRPFTIDPVTHTLKTLYSTFKDVQKVRIATSNRLYNGDEAVSVSILLALEEQEAFIEKGLKKLLKEMPIYTEFLEIITGIGPALAAGLIAFVGDIDRFDSIAKMNAYFGLHVVDGKAPRRVAGQLANWHAKGRSLILGVLADQFVKQNTPVYREVYDREKAKQLEKLAKIEWPKKGLSRQGVAGKRARRKCAKVFMKHFFNAYKAVGRGEVTIHIDQAHRDRRIAKAEKAAAAREARLVKKAASAAA